MDDTTPLELEKIRMSLASAHKIAELEAHRHVAVLVVGLTIGGTAVLAALTRQLATHWAVVSLVLMVVRAGVQVRGLRGLKKELQSAAGTARRDVDRLISRGGD